MSTPLRTVMLTLERQLTPMELRTLTGPPPPRHHHFSSLVVARLRTVYRASLTITVVSDREQAAAWLRTPNRGLSGRTPLAAAADRPGMAQMVRLAEQWADGQAHPGVPRQHPPLEGPH